MRKDNKTQSNNKIMYVIMACFVISLLVICLGFRFISSGKVNFLNNNYCEEEQIELKHTNSVTVKSDGVYITDVSNVFENSSELSAKFIDDKSYDATIKGVSERKDIAIVSVSKKIIDSETLKQIKIVTLGNSNELKVKYVNRNEYQEKEIIVTLN